MRHIFNFLAVLLCLGFLPCMAQSGAQQDAEAVIQREFKLAQEKCDALRAEAVQLQSDLGMSFAETIVEPEPEHKGPIPKPMWWIFLLIVVFFGMPWGAVPFGVLSWLGRKGQRPAFVPLPVPEDADPERDFTMEFPEVKSILEKLPVNAHSGKLSLTSKAEVDAAYSVLDKLMALSRKGADLVEYINALGSDVDDAGRVKFCLSLRTALLTAGGCVAGASFLGETWEITPAGIILLLSPLACFLCLWEPGYYNRKPLSQRYINFLTCPLRTDIVRKAVTLCNPDSRVTAGYLPDKPAEHRLTAWSGIALFCFAPIVLTLYSYAVMFRQHIDKD